VNDDFRLSIERGDADAIRRALKSDPGLANATIRWDLNQDNESDPLHYVSDAVFNGWLTNGSEARIAEALLASGAAIEGTEGRESPLIAAVSLGVEAVARVLVEAGADLEATSIFGARALHWAAWTGASTVVELLVAHGATLEAKDSEFGATPLFWAVHGDGPNGPPEKRDQVGAARLLIASGATVNPSNQDGLSAVELAETAESGRMLELLRQHVS
jgi:ankyrin repeat protein